MSDQATPARAAGGGPDPERLATYLAQHLVAFRGPLELTRIGTGQSNPTYLVSAGGQRYVLRMKPGRAAELLPSAHQIEREYRVMAALESSGVPVPGVLHLCTDESVVGRAFYLMQYVAGRVLVDPRMPGLSPPERRAIFADMNRVLAQLHGLDHVALGLADFGRPGQYLARQIARWSRQYRASEGARIEDMERLIEWLPAHLPGDEATCLVHGDFRLDNMVIHQSEPRIVAVLDWELATLGSALADFAYHCLAWHFPAGTYRGLAGADLAALGIPTEAEHVAAYCRRTGRAAIPHWDYYIAYNCFRMAAIVQGIARRAELGIAAGADAAEFGRGARALAAIGWQRALAVR